MSGSCAGKRGRHKAHTHMIVVQGKKVGGRGRERSKSELSWAKGEEGEKEVPGEK